jgi:DNA-binding beta-propeller fold protein YncE
MTASDVPMDALPTEAPASPEAPTTDGAGPAEPTVTQDRPISRRKKILALLLLFLFLLLLLLAVWYLLFRKPIGELIPPVVAQPVPTYQYSLYNFTKPQDVAVSLDGSRIYITQTEGTEDTIVADRQGVKVGTLALPAGTSGHPYYVAVNPKTGEVYASDRRDGAVFVFAADGTYQKEFDPGATIKSWQPLGIGFDATGNLFVGDVAGTTASVHEFGPDGALLRDYGVTAGLSTPSGIAEDAAGNVYVTDTNNGRLLVFAPSGEQIGIITRGVAEGDLGLPVGVEVDDKGRILVVDSSASAVQIYSPIAPGARTPQFVATFGLQGNADGQFMYPNGIGLDNRGRIYVADWNNDRLQVWSY